MASAAANGWDSRIVTQLQIMRGTAERFDEAMLADAATAVPDGRRRLDTVLANSLSVAGTYSLFVRSWSRTPLLPGFAMR